MNLLHYSRSFVKRNASTILTCVGGVGVVATSIAAVKATPKALDILEYAKEEKGEELTKLEIVKAAGPAYIPAVLIGASTLACIFGANMLNKRSQAAIMSAYALLDNSYKEYKKKVIDLYGEETDLAVRTSVAKDHYDGDVINVEDEKLLFYDQFSERYFNATMETVLKAEYEINKKISLWGGAYLNEFYEFLGIDNVEYGTELGWSTGGLMYESWNSWLDFNHEKVTMDDGLECYIITMSNEPLFDYDVY